MKHAGLSHHKSLPLIISISFYPILFSVSSNILFFPRKSHISCFPFSFSHLPPKDTSATKNALRTKPLLLCHQRWHPHSLKGVRTRDFSHLSYPSPFFLFLASLLYSFFAEWDVIDKNNSPIILYLKLYVACTVPFWISNDISLQRLQVQVRYTYVKSLKFLF